MRIRGWGTGRAGGAGEKGGGAGVGEREAGRGAKVRSGVEGRGHNGVATPRARQWRLRVDGGWVYGRTNLIDRRLA